jgi:dolichol-phosphate mannosyltransferase
MISMSIDRESVCVLIPTLNEAPTIGALIQDFRRSGFSRILVIDGQSTDSTREIAAQSGARVVVQKSRGKGNALIEAFSEIEQPYVLMVDGDGTYSVLDADRMLQPLLEGYDQVIGNRLIEENRKAFSRLNFFGNNILNRLFKLAHSVFLFDILSGYRAFTLEAIKKMHLKEAGFGIETEISAEAVRSGQKIRVIPIRYGRRPVSSPTKLNPFHDGFKIMTTIYRLARMNNPLFYFGLIGVIITIAGIFTGIFVILEWLKQIEHLPLAILTVLLIVLGFQIFMFGILSDMMLSLHRDMVQEIQDLERRRERYQ